MMKDLDCHVYVQKDEQAVSGLAAVVSQYSGSGIGGPSSLEEYHVHVRVTLPNNNQSSLPYSGSRIQALFRSSSPTDKEFSFACSGPLPPKRHML